MDIQQIKYFSRVYEMRSFTQAADSLFISRQALRKSVARLAQEMGEPLFENRGNEMCIRDRRIGSELAGFHQPTVQRRSGHLVVGLLIHEAHS